MTNSLFDIIQSLLVGLKIKFAMSREESIPSDLSEMIKVAMDLLLTFMRFIPIFSLLEYKAII